MTLNLAHALAAVALGALILYALTGGADFGGGMWDRLARGPLATAQRQRIESAIAPIWETNHVWLIFVVVILFSGFPAAFAAVGIALYTPLSLALLGIVLRGAGFVFRQYGGGSAQTLRRWGAVFGWASVITPFFLGCALAALVAGEIHLEAGVVVSHGGWLGPFNVVVGAFVVVLFAHVAAIYLCIEAQADPPVCDAFRRRGLASGMLLGILSLLVRVVAPAAAPSFAERLFAWQGPALVLQLLVGTLALANLVLLGKRRYRAARAVVVAQVAAIVGGWGVAQYPYLIGDLRIDDAAAPRATLSVVLIGVAAGALVLVPSLLWMFRVFKADRVASSAHATSGSMITGESPEV